MNISIMLFGKTNSGKSTLLQRYLEDTFTETHLSTLGISESLTTITLEDKDYNIKIYDTGGSEKFRKDVIAFSQYIDIAIFCVDITDPQSFISIKNNIYTQITQINKKENLLLVLCETKCDLKDQRQVDINEVKDFINEKNIFYYSTSALNDTGISEMFNSVVKDFISLKDKKLSFTTISLNKKNAIKKLIAIDKKYNICLISNSSESREKILKGIFNITLSDGDKDNNLFSNDSKNFLFFKELPGNFFTDKFQVDCNIFIINNNKISNGFYLVDLCKNCDFFIFYYDMPDVFDKMNLHYELLLWYNIIKKTNVNGIKNSNIMLIEGISSNYTNQEYIFTKASKFLNISYFLANSNNIISFQEASDFMGKVINNEN